MENLPLQDHVGNLEFFGLESYGNISNHHSTRVCTLIGQRDEEEQIRFAIVKL